MRRAARTFDTWVLSFVRRMPLWLYQPFVVLCIVLSPIVWCAITGVVAVYAALTNQDMIAAAGILVILLVPLSELAKLVARRNRPDTEYAKAMRWRTYSFPSSHTYTAVLAGGYLIWILFAISWGWIALPLAGIIVAIGVARVYLGAHYPSDVLAGFLLAVAALLAVLYASSYLFS